jgi:hypothetical protein
VDVVIVVAGVASALFAFGALWFARDTVRETRALRREDRLARLPELVAEVGGAVLRIPGADDAPSYASAYSSYVMGRLRLAAAIVASGESLPLCHDLAQADLDDLLKSNSIDTAVEAALEEVNERLRTLA